MGGKKALGLSGINHDKFTSCVQSDLGISSSCAECYYATADYGFKNCKAACLLGWCKQGCLDCTKPAQDDLTTCAGFATGVAAPCMNNFLAYAWKLFLSFCFFVSVTFIGSLCMPGAGLIEVRSLMKC